MRLSKNFTLAELTYTSTGLDNTPNDLQKEKLLYLATYLLQPIRDQFGKLVINSAFRSQGVNKAIGGSATSQHQAAEAADFTPDDIDATYIWIMNNLKYGQLIKEEKNGKKWIHISLPRIGGMNMQNLTFDGVSYKPYVG